MNQKIVEMNNIVKNFPGVKALDNVSFSLEAGEVMALLGENGAGKSTLVKVLSGIHTRDGGDITLFGEKISTLTQKTAKIKGISIIHQELSMCKHLTVAQNIFLGRELTKGGIVDNSAMNFKAQEIMLKLGVDISPTTLVGDLQVSKQQMVEIAKALSIKAKVLIMDEPTSSLTSKEINELFKIINQLKKEGCGIIYISHRLEELKYIVDKVTIMRDGKFILCKNFSDIKMDFIISNMVGRKIKEKFPRIVTPIGEKVFEVKNISAGKMVKDVSFSVRKGEIVGIAGLMGAGRTEMTRAIFGVDSKDRGEIFLNNNSIIINRPIDAIKQGIVLVPEDRKKDGLCTKLSVNENIALPNLDMLINKIGRIFKNKEVAMVDKVVANLSIKLSSSDIEMSTLSGGNQQKVVVGKWLARNSKVIIFDEPTRGIDVAAKIEIYNLMNKLKLEGIGVLFISSEMPEIMGFSDRILVMCDGRITGELDIKEATQEKILKYATQFENKIDIEKEN